MIIGTNFKLSSKKYLDNRQQCASLNDLIINKDSILYPQGFEVYCIKEKAWYQNVSEGDTPEWKIRQSGTSEGGASIDDTKISATTTWSSEYIYDMKLELQDLITQTEDYVAEIDDRLLYVEGRLTSIGSFDGSYDSLTNKPEFPSLQGYATHEYVDEVIANIGKIEGTKDYNELINQPINNVAIEYIIDGRLIVNVDYLKVGKWYIVNTDLNEEYNSATSFSLVYYLSSDSYSIINTFENEDMHSLIYVSSEDEKEIKIKYITVNGETYELIYNKETNEKTLNLLSSSGNGNGGFSGDYNDLENRPCYEDEGDIPEYLNIEIYSDTDFSNKESIEIINGTADNGNCITYRKYVKLFSDITIDMINTMKEYGVFISKYEGQLIENPLIDILDESQADRGMYFIGLEFEFILQATEGYYLPENGLWYMESYVDRDLNGNLIAEYKTVDDFNGILLIKDNGKLNTGTIKQLDEKFIPNTIARIEDVNILIEENGISGDYNDLKNRPCYDTREFETVQILCDGNFEGKETLDEIYFAPFAKIADLNDNDIDSILSNGLKAIIKIYRHDENDELVLIEDMVSYSLQPVGGYDGLYSMKDNEYILIATKDITEPISMTKGLWVYYGNIDDDTLVCTYDISYDRHLSGELKQLDGGLLPEGLPYDTREFEEVKLAIDENFDITGKETAIWQVEEIENEEIVTYNMMFAKLYDSDFDVQKVVYEGLIEFYGMTYPANDYCYQEEEFYSIFDQFIVAEKDGTIFTKGIWGLYSINEEPYYNPDEDIPISLIFKALKNGKLHVMDSKFIPYKPGLIIEEGTKVFPSIWYIDEKSGVYGTGDEECSIGKGAEIFNDYYADINDYTSSLVNRNIAIGDYSHAEGRASYAKGNYSHTEGYSTYAAKDCTHAEGYFSQAVGEHSHTEGYLTQALGKNQHVQGMLNIPDPDNKYAHIVGNGVLEDEEYLDGITFSNAHTLDWKGNAWYQGNVSVEGTPTNDNDLTTKKYVDDLVSNVDIDLSDYITDTELEEKGYITEIPSEYITNTELEEKGYITEIPSEYITNTELEEKGYVTDTELEEEMIFETDILTVNSLGGISANTDLNGLTVKEILNKLLFPYIEPVIAVTATPNGGTYEKGSTQTITNVKVVVTKKSEKITKIEVLNGTQVLARQQDEAINNGGTFNYNVNVSVPSTNKQLTVKVTDNSGNAITKTTNSFTFVYPYYYGVCDEGTTINGDLIKSLTKSVTSKGTKTVTYTTNNQRMIFAYPKSYGVITKILDPNSFDVTSTFTMSQITIIGLDGTGQSYYVYVNSPSTVSNFNMKFSY